MGFEPLRQLHSQSSPDGRLRPLDHTVPPLTILTPLNDMNQILQGKGGMDWFNDTSSLYDLYSVFRKGIPITLAGHPPL